MFNSLQTEAEANVRDRRQATAHLRVQTAAQGKEVGGLRRRRRHRRSHQPTPPALARRHLRRRQGADVQSSRLRRSAAVPRRHVAQRQYTEWQRSSGGGSCWIIRFLVSSLLAVFRFQRLRIRYHSPPLSSLPQSRRRLCFRRHLFVSRITQNYTQPISAKIR